ncbi:hypothetical protein ElyMa_003587300 [Elysia marginata]|uniref:DNA recombination and repair protein Rad51-like C-terminal domain-containing protein n=1 Tax=Elysia marginata TaxID=1093978 RepID=A0AAV4ENI4_9GAST|nr:hypothetical protein ElyMa_003587300 [Elysia marginata]
MSRECLEYEAHNMGIFIVNQFNVSERRLSDRNVPVDGYDPVNKSFFISWLSTARSSSLLVRGKETNPIKEKSMEALATDTMRFKYYLKDTVKVEVIGIKECELLRKKQVDPETTKFMS